jgi:hypothetical protein
MRTKLVISGLLLALVAAGAYWYFLRGTKLSETGTIFIADFANTTGESIFDGFLREALEISLAQSPSLNVISEEKVSEALRSQGRGRAQALGGSTNAARTSYQQFFALWKDADPGVPILKSARAEFAKLK